MTMPKDQIVEPNYHDVLVIPCPGAPGKDGLTGPKGDTGAPGKDGSVIALESMRFTQNTPASTWVINHNLKQPISACHIVSGGEPIMVSWMETAPGEIQVFFASPASGTVTIS